MPPRQLPLTLCLLLTGCTVEQYSQFRGTLAHDTPPTPTPNAVHDLGGSFSYSEENAPDVITGFHLGAADQGYLVFVHDRPAAAGPHVTRPTDATLSAVYYATIPLNDDDALKKNFFHLDPPARDQLPGLHRLHGTVHVERWNSNIDFRIRLAMRTATDDPNPTTIDGLLTQYERLEPHPLVFLAGLLMWLGVGPS